MAAVAAYNKNLMFKIISIILGVLIVGWFLFSRFSSPDSDIITRNGLHWHSNLTIKILGEAQEIPAGLGLENLPHNPTHTHDRDNVIHMEFAGLVKKDDIKLGKFFQIWGKTFNKDCIFDKCSGQEGQLKMLVNGKENGEFENYAMQNEDKIEITFEKEEGAAETIKEITIIGTEFSFSPSSITVKAGEKVKITFQNKGSASHNLVIEGLGVSAKTIGSGKEDIIEFTAPASGTYAIFCSIPGHKAAGMEGSLIIE